ncbi:MAG TPA: hypothetical protein VK141_03530 [Nitrosomonas sp.]|nr:hypothetical protein [Nitrosomonas sp.]
MMDISQQSPYGKDGFCYSSRAKIIFADNNEKEKKMFKKTISALTLVIAISFTSSQVFAACSADTEKDGKTACGANQVCYLVEGACIDKKSLPAGKACKKSGVCQNSCVKDDGKETKEDGSESGQCS